MVKRNRKKQQAPHPPSPALPPAKDDFAEWNAWFEEAVEYHPTSVAGPNGERPRRKAYRDAYEKSKVKFMLRYKLPPIQESTLSETALESEEQLENGAVIISQDEDGSHVTRFSVSDSLSNINSAFINDENENKIIPVAVKMIKPTVDVTKSSEDITVSDLYASIEIDEPPTAVIANGHVTDLKDSSDATSTPPVAKTGTDDNKMNGHVQEDSDDDDSEPRVVIIGGQVPLAAAAVPAEAAEADDDDGEDGRKDSTAPILAARKRKRKRHCTIIVLVLIGLGIVSSAVAVYFAISAIQDGT